jgi:hypothetical protein
MPRLIGRTGELGQQACPAENSRTRPFLDPACEQARDLGDPCCAQVRPPLRSVDVTQVAIAVELREVSKNASAARLASSAAAVSSARSPRCGPSGDSSAGTCEPTAIPACCILVGFIVNPQPLSPGSSVTRTRQPLTVPLT